MLLGAGQPSIELPPVARADEALRPPVRAHLLADEVLFDVDLVRSARVGRNREDVGVTDADRQIACVDRGDATRQP